MVTRSAAAQELLNRRCSRSNFLECLKYVWWMPHKLSIGSHTREVCAAVDRAITRYLAGESSFLDITIPFRHGKSDLISRALPGYFLGRCADRDPDIVMSGYGSSLVEGFSRNAKSIINSPRYQKLFPEVKLSEESNTASEWGIAGRYGKVTAVGLGGALAGKGYHLGVVDDYCKNRAEAESKVYRESTWDAFSNDFMTRRAPVSITIVCATSWHVDDIRGRIREKMKLDSDFPRFECLHFPARFKDGTYLFPERFDEQWYRTQYATLGKYAAAGLLDGNPLPAEGNVAKREWFKVVDAIPAGRTARGWDLAATVKKTSDFSSGCKMVQAGFNYYIADFVHERIPAGSVINSIQSTAMRDGKGVEVVVEQEGGASGPIVGMIIVQNLAGWMVYSTRPAGDKLTRALPLFAQAEAGNVYVLRAPWTDTFLDECVTAFPNGNHDDMIDSAATTFNHIAKTGGGSTW